MAILRNAHFDALTSGNITTANESGIDTVTGTNPTYSTTDALHGQAGMLTVVSVTSLVRQNLPIAAGQVYMRGYFKRVGANTGTLPFAIARDPSATIAASVAFNAAGNVVLRNGAAAVQTSTFVATLGTWFRIEWDIDRASNTQTLTLHHGADLESNTISETLSGACTAGTGTIADTGAGANSADAGTQIAVDELAIGDAAIGPFPAPTITVTVWDGAAEVPATVNVWDGASEVAASVDSIAP